MLGHNRRMSGAQCLADMLDGYGVTHVFMVPAVLRRTLAEMERRTAIKRILSRERDAARLARDVRSMRQLLASEKGDDDVADLKNMKGGLVDIDFCAQFLVLAHAARQGALLAGSVEATLEAASTHGLLADADRKALVKARALYTELLQRERLRSSEAAPINWNDPSILRDLGRDLGFASGPALSRAVDAQRAEVAAIYKRVVRAD